MRVQFTVHGTTATDLRRAAERECLRFFDGPCDYEIEARPKVQSFGGGYTMYEGIVTASSTP